jgi:hypothetical protein
MTLSVVRITLSLLLTLITLSFAAPSRAQVARPDLDIYVVTFSNYTTTATLGGRTVTLYWSKANVYVRNLGNAPTQACKLRMDAWKLDDTFLVGTPENTFFASVPIIAPGQMTIVEIIQPRLRFDFRAEHLNLTQFKLLVDCGFQVAESNENNNTHTVWGEINN